VDSLGAASVNLRVLFWVDTNQHADIKVKSSVIRLVKTALEEQGFSMPDEAREVIFPNGVPVQMIQAPQDDKGKAAYKASGDANGQPQAQLPPQLPSDNASAPLTTAAEGGLTSEDDEIKAQSRASRTPEEDTNLLEE
jgi:hypothetical protein